MKRILILLLTFLFLPMAGCASGSNDTVTFYYCRNPEQHQFFDHNSVIHPESRELSSHRNDLKYILSLYLAGPMEEGLISPFPKNTRILSVQQAESEILIELTDLSIAMTDSEFTLGSACLTLTCLDLTSCSTITVHSAERTISMNSDNIVLSDIIPQQESSGG